jgi:hypothetical protein
MTFHRRRLGGNRKQFVNQNWSKYTIIIGGLFIQLIFIGAFIRVAISFLTHLWKVPATRALGIPWEKHMAALYASSILIVVGWMFREIDCLQGFSGYVLSHEAFFYVFDASLMLSVMLIFN